MAGLVVCKLFHPLNHLKETACRDFTALPHFRKYKGQVFFADALCGTDVSEKALDSVDADKVVVHDSSLGNILLETSGQFLRVAVSL